MCNEVFWDVKRSTFFAAWDVKLFEHQVYSSRFFARAGTPAAKLPQLPHTVTKRRSLAEPDVGCFAPAVLVKRKMVGSQSIGKDFEFRKKHLGLKVPV